MKQQKRKWISLIILISVLSGYLFSLTTRDASALENAEPLPAEAANDIRNVTVQITMIRFQLNGAPAGVNTRQSGQSVSLIADRQSINGIGTLLSYEDKTLLISHNHWSFLTPATVPDFVQFHDADGQFLLEMEGQEFSQLILFHDGGTLIMRAPRRLTELVPTPAAIGQFSLLQPGDIVYVAHRQVEHSDSVVLLAAQVLAVETRDRIPVLSLRSLNGHAIRPGDSGGGVWLDGQYMGNLWMTVREVRQRWWRLGQPVESDTARSYAAGLTEELVELVTVVLEPQEQPALQADGPS